MKVTIKGLTTLSTEEITTLVESYEPGDILAYGIDKLLNMLNSEATAVSDLAAAMLACGRMHGLMVHTKLYLTNTQQELLPELENVDFTAGHAIYMQFKASNSLSYSSLISQLRDAPAIDGPYSLSIRETHKYVGACRHMDDWTRIGQVGVIAEYHRGEESYESGRDLKFLWVESDSSPEDIRKAIFDTYTCQGCSCEHDCCGCVSATVRGVKRLDENIWACSVSWYRNI